MNTETSGAEKIMFAALGLVGLLLAVVGLGMVTNRFACEQWATPESAGAVLGFFGGADMGAFGRTPSGCAGQVWHLIVVVLILVILVVGVIMTVVILRSRYLQSDRYLVKTLRLREGVAKQPEVRRAVGKKAALSAVKKVRPTLKKQPADKARGIKSGRRRARDPQEANLLLGRCETVPLYASMEESILLLGPPRSGKGVGVLVGAIIDAPGPVITTSSRADNLAMTMHKRADKGPVAVFDPQGLTGQKTNFKWSPISGCDSPLVANQRATSLIQASGLSPDSNNAEWAAPATQIMECLLHAAALGDPEDGRPGTIDDLVAWGNTEAEAETAAKWLKAHEKAGRAAPGWGDTLAGVIGQDAKMRGNMWFGVRNAVKGLAVPNVRAALQPESEAETFDIDEFLENNGTLYIVGTKTGGSSVGPFLIAMMDAITEHAREKAAKKTGNRLDPPLALILDEIANIATAWPGLIQLMADGGGVGITPFPVFQSLAQVKKEWGPDSAAALWEAATIKLQLGGTADTDTLETIQKIAGTYEHRRDTKSRGQGGASFQEQYTDKNVLEADEIRRIPTVDSPVGPHALMFFRRSRPILAKLRPYFKRSDAKEIDANKKRYYQENNISEDTGRRVNWEADPGNRPQPIRSSTQQVHRQAESVEQTKQRLADESHARNQHATAHIPGYSWDEETGNVVSAEDQEESPVGATTSTAGQGQDKRGKPSSVRWG